MQRKDQGLPILLYPLRFSVDNLSWPFRSGELCSRALGQDTGSRPPLGRRRGAGARRPARSATRQAGDPGSVRGSASPGDRGRRVQAYWERAPHGLLQPLPGHGWETLRAAHPQGPPAAPSSHYPGFGVSRKGARAIGGRLQGGRETGFQSTVGYQLGHHGRKEYREGAETEWVWAGAAGERGESGR